MWGVIVAGRAWAIANASRPRRCSTTPCAVRLTTSSCSTCGARQRSSAIAVVDRRTAAAAPTRSMTQFRVTVAERHRQRIDGSTRPYRCRPQTSGAHLGSARSFQEYLAYEYAYAEYRELMRLMPQDVNITRETARLVEDWRGLECASPIYADGQAALLENADFKAAQAPATAGAAVADPVDAASESLALAPESQLLSAEYEARYLRGWRLHQAIPAYQRLIDMEPSNEAAVFDLAQCQSVAQSNPVCGRHLRAAAGCRSLPPGRGDGPAAQSA